MPLTKKVKNAKIVLTWEENGVQHSLTGKVDTEFDYYTEYETIVDENGAHRSQFLTKSEVTAVSTFITDNEEKFFTIKASPELTQHTRIEIRIPALTPENIERAYAQAGVDRDKGFQVRYPGNVNGPAILVWDLGSELKEVWGWS